jgi:hypothetical protein
MHFISSTSEFAHVLFGSFDFLKNRQPGYFGKKMGIKRTSHFRVFSKNQSPKKSAGSGHFKRPSKNWLF